LRFLRGMTIENKHKTLAVAVIGAGIMAWSLLGARVLGDTPFLLCVVLLGGGITVMGGLIAMWVMREKKQQDEFRRQVHTMCLCQARPGSNDDLPALPPDHPWSNLAEQIRKTILDCKRRAQDLEHVRTAQEASSFQTMVQAEQIKNIFKGLADPILVINDYDELVLANESAEKIFHFEAENTQTRALRQIVKCQKLIDLLTSVRQRKTKGAHSEEIEIACDEEQTLWFRATASKLSACEEESSDESTPTKGTVLVLRNIAEQKAIQKRNAEFVSSVSHEMKTPLAGIKAYVELLSEGEVEDEKTKGEFLDVISSQAERLQRLVENVLNLARIEAGVVSVNKQQCSLNEILEESLQVVQWAAEAKKIAIESQLNSMYLYVLVDRDMLLQAAINLLSNAIKYTHKGGRVILRSRLVGDQVRFEVQDNGVGLTPEDCQRVFEKFYRVKKDKDMAPGTGLGLSLAKHIVEDVHGGQLTVDSAPGEGSTFAVTLPGAAH